MEVKEAANLIMYLAHKTADNFVDEEYLKHEDKISAKFEALLIFFPLALQEIKLTLPAFSDQIESQMFHHLFSFCYKVGLISRLEPNMPDFIDNRFAMYKEDLNKLMRDQHWIMAQSIHAIYYEPLKEEITIANCFINRKDLSNDTPLPFMFSSELLGIIEIFMASIKTITRQAFNNAES